MGEHKHKQNRLNEAPILDQIEGQYEKFLLLILRKYVPDGAVITNADIASMLVDDDTGNGWVLFSHGHKDSIEFKAIRQSQVAAIREFAERTGKGIA